MQNGKSLLLFHDVAFSAKTKTIQTLTQYVTDFQSLQDERWRFFLVSKLPDKKFHLSSWSLAETLTYCVSKNTASLKNN